MYYKKLVFLFLFATNVLAEEVQPVDIVNTLFPSDSYANFSEDGFNTILSGANYSNLDYLGNLKIETFLIKHKSTYSSIVANKVTNGDILENKLVKIVSKLSTAEERPAIIHVLNIFAKSYITEEDKKILLVYKDAGMIHKAMSITQDVLTTIETTLIETYIEFFTQISDDAEMNGLRVVRINETTYELIEK